jgi:hypothetical protein
MQVLTERQRDVKRTNANPGTKVAYISNLMLPISSTASLHSRLGHGLQCLGEEVPRVVLSLAESSTTAVACGFAHTAAVGGVCSLTLCRNIALHSHFLGRYKVTCPEDVILWHLACL